MSVKLRGKLLEINPDLSDEELLLGFEKIKVRNCRAKEVVYSGGEKVCPLFLSTDSVCRCYYLNSENEECTLWMKPEMTFFSDYKSFCQHGSSQFFLQVYEQTELYVLSRNDYIELCELYSGWAKFSRLLMEQQHVTLIDVFVSLLANDATRNYNYIQYAFPRFIQVAPLKDIASMLQVSPVTLSRIRSGNQTKA